MSDRLMPDAEFLREMLGTVRGSQTQAGMCLGILLVAAERHHGGGELARLLRAVFAETANQDQIPRPDLERILHRLEAAVIELGANWSDTLYELAGEVVQRLRDALAATDW